MPENLATNSSTLCEIQPADLQEVGRFVARQIDADSGLSVPQIIARLHWIVVENPAREPGMPLGWCVRNSAGQIAGCMFCAPQRFVLGESRCTLMMSSSFYVDQKHRGAGTSIFMKFVQLGRRYALFSTSANAVVANMWKKLGAYPLGNSGHEMLGIVHWRGVVEDVLVRRLGSNSFSRVLAAGLTPFMAVSRRLPTTIGSADLVPLQAPEEAATLCAGVLPNRLTTLRDAAYFRWRYFSAVDPTTRLFAYRPLNSDKRLLVGINQRRRGYRQQIRALNLLDLFGEPNPEDIKAIANLLLCQYRNKIDMLVFRCLDPASQQAIRPMGFVRREFDAPIAWCLDKSARLPSHDFYLVPADGDMLL